MRIVRRPIAKPSWLLGCTALVAGALAGGMVTTGSAWAADPCPSVSNYYTCVGTTSVHQSIGPVVGGAFRADLGSDEVAFRFTGNSSGAGPAVSIDANGQSASGQDLGPIRLFGNSFINNFADSETGIGLEILNPGTQVDLQIDGRWDDEEVGGSIIGTTGLSVQSGTPGGYLHVSNNGHIEGKAGDGIAVNGNGHDSLAFELDNHSYQSIIGSNNGVWAHNGLESTQINNGGGLIAGLGNDGVLITDNFNSNSSRSAVQVNNDGLGIIVGQNNGIEIAGDITNGDEGNGNVISINNGISFNVVEGSLQRTDGGLIYGDNGSGISIDGSEGETGIDGNVYIGNGGTRGATFDPNSPTLNLDPQVLTPSSGLVTSLADAAGLGGRVPLGIYGEEDGVSLNYIGGNVEIDNAGGTKTNAWDNEAEQDVAIAEPMVGGSIVGLNYGISIDNVGGHAQVNNSNRNSNVPANFVAGNFGGTGGLIIGADDNGVSISNVDEWAKVNNNGGTIWGYNDGVDIYNVGQFSEDGINVDNAAGRIIGFDTIGVDVGGTNYANVNNWFKEGESDTPTWGGQILGGEQAIYMEAAEQNFVGNGPGGFIIGNAFGDANTAVVEFRSDGWNGLENFGLISTDGVPHFNWNEDGYYSVSLVGNVVVEDPGYTIDQAAIVSDVSTFGQFAWTGGQLGGLINSGTSLSDYGYVASMLAVQGYGLENDYSQSANIWNYSGGLLFGQIQLATEDGASFENLGTWYVTDSSEDGFWPAAIVGNPFAESINGNIDNGGLVQTAFSGERTESASFFVGQFNNGSYGRAAAPGLLSATDGGAGDVIAIFGGGIMSQSKSLGGFGIGNLGYFAGSEDGGPLTSFIGLDVNLGPADAEDPATDDWNDPEAWRADRFATGYLEGSTGLILNKINDHVTDSVGDTVIVAHADEVGEWQQIVPGCDDIACKAGDPLYIASQSEGYVDVNGTGIVQDGLYGWYLHSVDSEDGHDYVLVSDWAPTATQLPSVVSGAQNAFYDVAGQVEDHIYGQQFPSNAEGGSGADLPVGETPVVAAPAGGTPAIWAKVTGDHFTRDTTVAEALGGITTNIDTGLVQDTFSMLVGADYQPNGAGNDGVRAGVFGAYINSGLGFDSFGATATYTGGSIGGYAAYTSNGFYVDGEAKLDVLNVTYSSTGLSSNALSTSVGLLGNAGYRMQLGASFVEPIISAAYVNTTIQDLTVGGASASFSNGQSFRLGIGGRVGTQVALSDEMSAEFALTGKVWNEFGAANTVTVSDGLGNSNSFSNGISGVFGEVALSGTLYNSDKSMSAFASVGDKFNASFNSLSGKAGFRKSF